MPARWTLCACLAVLAAADEATAVETSGSYSVFCSPSSCRPPSRGRDGSATAFASFDDHIEKTGWASLAVGSDLEEGEGPVAFGAGYLEGYLTADRVLQMLGNFKAHYGLDPSPTNLTAFLRANDVWVRDQLQGASAGDPFWGAVRFLYQQLDGLVAGVNARLGPKSVSREDLQLLNLQGDIADLKLVTNVSSRPDFGIMDDDARDRWQLHRSHCSALVKLLPDGSDLLTGHTMWWGYYAMLRVFKHYSFPRVLGGRMASVSLSSYPGILASTDDFYQASSRLVVMETTNNLWDMSLYDLVRPAALSYWVRAMAATFLARNGSDWMALFQRHNSGTYNNMWMVVDYNLFNPGKRLPAGVLTVGEQLPGYFHSEDQTHVLSYGYWPSYNVALYPETSRLSGQDAMEAKFGNSYSYHFAARAEIFRRDQATVLDEAGMKRILRYNMFQKDPLAEGQPCNQLACRGDLKKVPDAVGAIDGKYTTHARVGRGQTVVVSGPTHDDQSVFDWRSVPAEVASEPHVGQPQRFDFDWVTMGPFSDSRATRQDLQGEYASPLKGIPGETWTPGFASACEAKQAPWGGHNTALLVLSVLLLTATAFGSLMQSPRIAKSLWHRATRQKPNDMCKTAPTSPLLGAFPPSPVQGA